MGSKVEPRVTQSRLRITLKLLCPHRSPPPLGLHPNQAFVQNTAQKSTGSFTESLPSLPVWRVWVRAFMDMWSGWGARVGARVLSGALCSFLRAVLTF